MSKLWTFFTVIFNSQIMKYTCKVSYNDDSQKTNLDFSINQQIVKNRVNISHLIFSIDIQKVKIRYEAQVKYHIFSEKNI